MTREKRVLEYGAGAFGRTAEISLCQRALPGKEALC